MQLARRAWPIAPESRSDRPTSWSEVIGLRGAADGRGVQPPAKREPDWFDDLTAHLASVSIGYTAARPTRMGFRGFAPSAFQPRLPLSSTRGMSTAIGFSPATAIGSPQLAVTLSPHWWPSVLPSALSSRSRARRARRAAIARCALRSGASPPCRRSPGRGGRSRCRRSAGRGRGAAAGRRSRRRASWASARRSPAGWMFEVSAIERFS